MINADIMDAAIAFENSTGKKPKHAYIGRMQMRELMRWASANQYVVSPDAKIEGDSRPEVYGMYVFEVNADYHLVCA